MPSVNLPRPVRFMVLHAAIGFGLATLFIVALLWANPGGVAEVLRRAPGHPWPLLLLWFFCGLTLGGVQTAAAAMLLEERPQPDDQQNGPNGGRAPAVTPAPARVSR